MLTVLLGGEVVPRALQTRLRVAGAGVAEHTLPKAASVPKKKGDASRRPVFPNP